MTEDSAAIGCLKLIASPFLAVIAIWAIQALGLPIRLNFVSWMAMWFLVFVFG